MAKIWPTSGTRKLRFQRPRHVTKLYGAAYEDCVKPQTSGCNIMPGEHLDLSSGEPFGGRSDTKSQTSRKFVGVHFACCDVYTRVYVNRDATAYEGNCPKCAKRVRLPIGPGGTDSRFFTAR